MPIRVPLQPYLRRRRPAKVETSVSPLTLVSASYESTVSVTLTFDRAIDVAGVDGAAITVADGSTGFRYAGTGGAIPLSANVVELLLEGVEEIPLGEITMTATAANGIVALDDDVAWAGVVELGLPFP
jgi:hypothetical protein